MQILSQTSQLASAESFTDVAGIDRLQRNRPLNLTDFPPGWQLPFQFAGKSSVAGKFPISMPGWSHSQQQTDSKRFAWNNCVRVGEQLRPNELFSLILLAEAVRRKSDNRPAEHPAGRKSRWHSHTIR